MSQKNSHRPFHLYSQYGYFITARTYQRIKYFNTDERKKIFTNKLSKLSKEFNVGIISWVLLDNHYHLIITFNQDKKGLTHDPRECVLHEEEKKRLSEFFRKLHSQTTSTLNQNNNTPGRKIWYQYWDYCIRNQTDFWKHFNYLIQNPLKHQLVKSLKEAYYYKYSSNLIWLKRFNEEGLSESFVRYPVKDWTPNEVEI